MYFAPEQQSQGQAFSFGRRDPHDKARRLARVLVSDMIMYNPERHSRAIAAGFTMHVPKPVDPFELTAVIAEAARTRTPVQASL